MGGEAGEGVRIYRDHNIYNVALHVYLPFFLGSVCGMSAAGGLTCIVNMCRYLTSSLVRCCFDSALCLSALLMCGNCISSA